PDKARVRRALDALDLLVVIDSLPTDTAKAAHVVFADVPAYAKTGTLTNGERRVDRLHAALDALGDARPAPLALTDLAIGLAGPGVWSYDHPDDITDEIAERVPGYERFRSGLGAWGKQHVAPRDGAGSLAPVARHDATPAAAGELTLTTGRTLFTSLEGAAVHAKDADKLHREEYVEMHPSDAAALGLKDGDEVVLQAERGELAIRCRPSGRVLEGVAFVPYYYDGGAVTALFGPDGAPVPVRVRVRTVA